jgi:hypothetical protein
MADPTNPSSTSPGTGPTTQEYAIGGAVGAKAVAELLKSLPGGSELVSKFSNSLNVAADSALYFSGVSDGLRKSIDGLASAFNVKNIDQTLKSLSDSIKSQINDYQNLDQQIIKLGRGEDSKAYIESIRTQAFESAKLGLSQKNLINIYEGLLGTYTGATKVLTRQTEEFENNKKQISELIGFNSKFGISQQQTTEILNLMNVAMGGGSQAAQKLSDSLLIFSQRTGQSANKVFGEFNSNIDRFATLSADRAVQSFQKLELAASRTGTSVSKVISAVEKFDDIEQGFQAGGQLNRVLSFMGGSFDTFKAMQATDEERAQMLYTAIAQTGDRFQSLQTEQAKRAMVKQIAESSGLDPKTILGLLNKSTNLAEDVKELSMRPAVKEEFTEQGRKDAAMRATTIEQLGEIQDSLLNLNPLIDRLGDAIKGRTEITTGAVVEGFAKTDTILKNATIQAQSAQGFFETAKVYATELGNIKTALQAAEEKFHTTTREQTEGVISRNTNILDSLDTSIKTFNLNAAKKLDVNVNVSTTPGTKADSQVKQYTAADATSGTANFTPANYTPAR